MHKATHESEIELVELMQARIAHQQDLDDLSQKLREYKALIDALAKEVG